MRFAFGMSGANIEDVHMAFHRGGGPKPIIVKHEANAVACAEGYYLATQRPGLVFSTSGGGAFNLIPSLIEARGNGVPMLALIGQIPSALEGRGGFQDSSIQGHIADALGLFRQVAVDAERVDRPEIILETLERSLRKAYRERGPVVVLLPKDVQQAEIRQMPQEAIPRILDAPEMLREETKVKIKQLVQQWQTDEPPLIVAGPQVAHFRLQDDVEHLCRRLGAYCATTPDGKWSFPTQSPYYLGTIGIMGHESVARQLALVRQVVVLGGHLGQMCSMPGLDDTSEIVYLGLEHPRSALPWRAVLPGDLRSLLAEFQLELGRLRDEKPVFPPASRVMFRDPTREGAATDIVNAPWLLQTIQPKASAMDIFVDAGNTGAYCLHYLTGNKARVFYTALAMGGMGQSFGAGIGSAVATQRPTLVISGDGSYLLAGGEIHTAVNHRLPILFIIFNNRSHAMCDLREQLYLGQSSDDNRFMPCAIGAGLTAMYPGLPGFDVSSKTEFESLWDHMDDYLAKGPMVISVNLSNDDLPPFAPFLQQRERLELASTLDASGC